MINSINFLGVLTLSPFFRFSIRFMPALILSVVIIPQASSVPLEDALDRGQAQNDLEKITGQKPIITKAKKSVASFKIRE